MKVDEHLYYHQTENNVKEIRKRYLESFTAVMMDKNEMKSQRKGLFEFFRTWCAYLFLQYELITCTCMFEPWEKVFINSLVLTIFGLVSYSSCVYLPQYLISLFDWLVQLSGTLTTMSFDW